MFIKVMHDHLDGSAPTELYVRLSHIDYFGDYGVDHDGLTKIRLEGKYTIYVVDTLPEIIGKMDGSVYHKFNLDESV